MVANSWLRVDEQQVYSIEHLHCDALMGRMHRTLQQNSSPISTSKLVAYEQCKAMWQELQHTLQWV